jgi:hypothetical protein
MFANLLQLISRRPPAGVDRGFVVDVNVRRRSPPNPRVERFILVCWLLIAVKHAAVLYACWRWPVPFNALWINAPTFALGALATTVYYRRR